MFLLHCGAKSATVDEVNKAPCPKGTKSWTPVPHGQFIEMVKDAAGNAGFELGEEQYGLYDDASRLFGVVEIKGQDHFGEQVQLMMGIRNSNDKSMAAGICAGSRVLVCDNLSFLAYTDQSLNGEPVFMKRMHTRYALEGIPPMLEEAMQKMLVLRDYQEKFFEKLATVKLTNRIVNDTIISAAEKFAIPWGHVQHVKKQWDLQQRLPKDEEEEARWHDEFHVDNAWSLYNCFTEVAKGYLGQNTMMASDRSIVTNGFFRDRFCGKNFGKN